MKINTRVTNPNKTAEGAPAAHLNAEQELRRSVMACMLWENSFYENGVDIATRIEQLVQKVNKQVVADIAVEARNQFKLRHAPLLLCTALAKHGGRLVGQTIEQVVQRADELAEFLSLYWRKGKTPVAKQVKIGLARAFRKFDAYQLAKYNRDNAIKLRDVLFLVHAKPKDEAQAAIWKQLVEGTLPAPDTWEVALSAGAGKKATFERLLSEHKLGYMALLRNLRNMTDAQVDRTLVEQALLDGAARSKALPFRFVAAVRAAPSYAATLDKAMKAALKTMERLPGRTVVLVDVSGSMDDKLSAKSDLTRMDAACALAALTTGVASTRVYTFSHNIIEVPAYEGLALCDAIVKSQAHGGTYLGAAVDVLRREVKDIDRLIVITDEQSHDAVYALPGVKNYMINVASEKHGVGYGPWVRIDGFSEAVLNYIQELERVQ